MKNLPDIDRMPLGRSILKNCRANASCVNCYVTLSINLPACCVRSRVRDSVLSPHPAPSVHIPVAYCTAASPVLPAVPGCCRTRLRWRCSRWQGECHPRTGLPPGWCPCCSGRKAGRSYCSAQNPASFGVKLAYGAVFAGNPSKEKA